MGNSVKLSNRLLQVATYLSKGGYFADIGSDHAYLPCYVCLQDKTAKAIAGEVNEGPYQSALRTVKSYGLNDRVEVRLGDGLAVIDNDEKVDHIVIAGMGGSLIKSILEDGKAQLKNVKRIIAQPNVDARGVRRWFNDNHFVITNESIIEENGHIYEVVVADLETKLNPLKQLTEKQLLFGPLLLENRTDVFYKKWKHEYDKLEQVINQMKNAQGQDLDKIEKFELEKLWIKEVLRGE
ncbi:tRNA (adenine(22)-N(1))-methyltransferase [Oceanobacillus bengalensis]|uniref:tRNA (Adenine(22)-N(1))-methyltransferase TrmK n=1 Tax=Oceanobacillus bengalensis TaxID=1435466 RepID=A0A494Z696_9BACI|nr:tRNA (adenine(22)-N(1))-methyltransferase TrmK [Oceanobacillus bengalensis]RKQ17835.1 tRNA (adenine(22)-N(1))-methyltransferase TrmK [Oceanobacillus bengalensis]